MKDAYSFDVDDEGMRRSYAAQREAYHRIFDRLGLTHVVVSATAGAMGGSTSEEFLAPCPAGEDHFVRCSSCAYAANVEAVTVPVGDATEWSATPTAIVVDTPGTPTIDALVEVLNERDDLCRSDRQWTAADTLKNILVMVTSPDGAEHPLAIGVPGDRDVDLKRLEASVAPASARVFEDADFDRFSEMVRGYIGPAALGRARGIRYVVDPRVAKGSCWVTGADEAGRHVINLVRGRDFEPDGVIDTATVRHGDPCPRCGAELRLDTGIEIGHVFQLGRKYAEALRLTVLNEHGRATTVTMGSYGIGVSRAVAAIAEQTHDGKDLRWPESVAPADVHIVATGRDEVPFQAAERLARDLVASGLSVLLDDRRGASPGVKFADVELSGIRRAVVVGKRLGEGIVELWDRWSGRREDVPVETALSLLLATVQSRQPRSKESLRK